MAKTLKNRLIYHIHDGRLARTAAKFAGGKLIDIGCGTKPYKEMFEPLVSEHVGVDHHDTMHSKSNIDLFGSAYDIPSDADTFDTALCTGVLEHLEEPADALRECFRVLRPGGYAIYSVPHIWHIHEEPRDFFRYTQYGLDHLFKKAGFDVVEISPLSGFHVTFGQLLVYYIYRFNRGPVRFIPIIPLIGIVIQGAAFVFDKIDWTPKWTWAYMAVAQKPSDPAALAAKKN